MKGGLPLPGELEQGQGPCIPRICEGRCPSALPLSGRSARAWPCHARHPGDFRFTTKVTKGVSGGIPLNPRGGCFAPPAASRTPSIGGSGTNPAGFATLTQSSNWHFFLLELHRGNTHCFQTVARGLLAPNVSAVSGLCQVCVREFGFVKPFVGP